MDLAGNQSQRHPYHNRNVGIFTVHDGKIVSVREYTDTLHVARALFPA